MKLLIFLFALSLLLLLFGCGVKQEDLSSIAKIIPGEIPTSIPLAEPPVTQEMADRVQLSMSWEEVTGILDSSGVEVPRETKNISGVKRYVWRNRAGSALILDFKDNKLGAKEWRKPKK